MIPSISYENVYLLHICIETDRTETHTLPIIDWSKPKSTETGRTEVYTHRLSIGRNLQKCKTHT